MRRITVAAIALALTAMTAPSGAQPYGILSAEPGYWHPLGSFDTPLSGDDAEIFTGHILAFSHPGFNPGPNSFSNVWVAEVFDDEQVRPGHGAFWQLLLNVRVKCYENKYRVEQVTFYNKPRVSLGADMADELWREEYGPQSGAESLDEKYFEPVKSSTLAAEAAKVACSEPEGMND
jgi:hypothetical protein